MTTNPGGQGRAIYNEERNCSIQFLQLVTLNYVSTTETIVLKHTNQFCLTMRDDLIIRSSKKFLHRK